MIRPFNVFLALLGLSLEAAAAAPAAAALLAPGRRLAQVCKVGAKPGQCSLCLSARQCATCRQAEGKRGYYVTSQGGCALCPDAFCKTCGNGAGACLTCVTGYTFNPAGKCVKGRAPAPAPIPPVDTSKPPTNWPAITRAGNARLPIAPRIQYLIGDGFCGENALQMAAMYYGVWLPQKWLRFAAGAPLLPYSNMAATMSKVHLSFVQFEGYGYFQFAAFAKGWLLAGRPVITVAYLPEADDPDYDHVQPIIGVRSSSTAPYDPSDVFYVNTDVEAKTIERRVGDFGATRKACRAPIERGGCVPMNTVAGYAVTGVAYGRLGVELRTTNAWEPTNWGSLEPLPPQNWQGTAVVKGLTRGQAYTLYKFTKDPARVPASPGAPLNAAAAAWSATFVAGGASQQLPVTFNSGEPTWFVAEPAPAVPRG